MKKSLLGAVVFLLMLPLFALGQTQQGSQGAVGNAKVAHRDIPNNENKGAANEHPLVPVLRWAQRGRPDIEKIKDYTAVLTKQETIDGEVQEAQVMDVKVRHEPFSVYVKLRWPRSLAGQEAIYIRGQNDDKVLAHGTGLQKRLGTLKLDPSGFVTMRGNKYPITEMGLLNLIDKLVEVGERDVKFGECTVEYFENVKMDDRDCTMIKVTHPVPRKSFRFHIAQIVVDNELNVPLRYDSYDWPTEPGKEAQLIEAYVYQKLQLNVGLTDEDFSTANPKYDYAK